MSLSKTVRLTDVFLLDNSRAQCRWGINRIKFCLYRKYLLGGSFYCLFYVFSWDLLKRRLINIKKNAVSIIPKLRLDHRSSPLKSILMIWPNAVTTGSFVLTAASFVRRKVHSWFINLQIEQDDRLTYIRVEQTITVIFWLIWIFFCINWFIVWPQMSSKWHLYVDFFFPPTKNVLLCMRQRKEKVT